MVNNNRFSVGEAPKKIGASPEQQKYIDYAWKISQDKEFIYMMEGENSLWTPDRQSDVVKNGFREQSYGFCQINKHFHSHIVNDPRFKDPYWQLDKCLELWKGGTAFYGYNNRWYSVTKFQ